MNTFTNGQIRNAILNAADQIEQYPETFYFHATDLPILHGQCGSPGCAIGWIGHFLGSWHFKEFEDVTRKGMNLKNDTEFYRRMDAIADDELQAKVVKYDRVWWASTEGQHLIPTALRRYADIHHPLSKGLDWNAIAMSGVEFESEIPY